MSSQASFRIGGQLEIQRLGFGAMRVTGAGIWGDPADRAEALRTLRRVPELGIDFIDTADSYGPNVSEELIREALHPYAQGRPVIATKAGLQRPGPDQWVPHGQPEYLIRQAHASRERLGVEAIDLWQLHRIDSRVPRDEQFDAIRQLLNDGVIRFAGLSEVDVDDVRAAQRFFPVATVQNRYNLFDRGSEAVLELCEQHGIGFIPWFPLGAGGLTAANSPLGAIAARHGVNPGQLALAWLLHRSPVMLPIPGTSKVAHLEQNVRARDVVLSADDMKALDALAN